MGIAHFLRRRTQQDPTDPLFEGDPDVVHAAIRVLREAAGEIDGNPLWYRSNGWGDYFVMDHLTNGTHYNQRGVYINRVTGLPFYLDVELADFDDAYRCGDGQLRLTAARILGERLLDVEEHPGYQLASKTAGGVVAARSPGCTTLEEFNDDPGLCAGGTDVAAVFRAAAGRLARSIR